MTKVKQQIDFLSAAMAGASFDIHIALSRIAQESIERAIAEGHEITPSMSITAAIGRFQAETLRKPIFVLVNINLYRRMRPNWSNGPFEIVGVWVVPFEGIPDEGYVLVDELPGSPKDHQQVWDFLRKEGIIL